MLVSIAISTYEANGRGHILLKQNIDSIMKQSYENIEIVISDHSSDDNIKKLCLSYKNAKYPIKYIHNNENKGSSSANTNNAINNCDGEYIKILFMDDYLFHESAISEIVENFKQNSEKKWLVHSYVHTRDYKYFYRLFHPSISKDIIFCNLLGCPSCVTIHKSVKERFDVNLKWFMDCEWYYRIIQLYGNPIFLHSNIPLMVNLHHSDQVTNTSITTDLVDHETEYIKTKYKN
jgi:glycosyltransferase involved in cell wall biosynthesis